MPLVMATGLHWMVGMAFMVAQRQPIKGAVVRAFLESNNVDYRYAPSTARLEAAETANRARQFIVCIKCWR